MITIEESTLKNLLIESAKLGAELGAERVFRKFARYNYSETAKLLSIDPKTLAKRIKEGKIKAVDGIISGEEIDKYLKGK